MDGQRIPFWRSGIWVETWMTKGVNLAKMWEQRNRKDKGSKARVADRFEDRQISVVGNSKRTTGTTIKVEEITCNLRK